MLQTLRNAWKVEEIRKKILFTLLIVLLYRLGNAIPVPYVNVGLLQNYFDTVQNTVLGLLDVMSGGAFSTATIFALSIQPYINASIIIQLLCIAIPALERLSKDEGEEGRKKIASITRYATVGIGLLQGFGYYMLIKNNNFLVSYAQNNIWAAIVIILTFTSGSALIMWLGEQITEYGIGNGISMILFASIISRLPTSVITSIRNISTGSLEWWIALLVFLGALAIIVLIVYVNDAERRIPVQYAKRVVGRKMYGGQSSNLPLKMNMAGVMPVIFASSIASIPATLAGFFPKSKVLTKISEWFSYDTWLYLLIYLVLIVAFSFFYIMISFNVVEVANNIQQNGGSIPGIRSGRPTVNYISKILNRVTIIGAIFLCIVAGLPMLVTIINSLLQDAHISSGFPISNLAFGGNSLLIIVGVAIETVHDLEAQVALRNYGGSKSKGIFG